METDNVFYNTINLTGDELAKSIANAKTQDEKIYNYFLLNPEKLFTPFDVLNAVFDSDTPITSVRRSITNLEQNGKLTKTNVQKGETFGKPNYMWKLFVSSVATGISIRKKRGKKRGQQKADVLVNKKDIE